MTDQANSRLLSLPAEIRNHIYRLVAVHQEPIQVTANPKSAKSISFTPRFPGLALTCRSTLRELEAIFYEENTFDFTEYALRSQPLEAFKQRAGESLSKITTIKITRAIGSGTFGTRITFTAEVSAKHVSISNFHDEYVNAPLELRFTHINGVGGACCCIAEVIAKEAGSLFEFLEQYLDVEGTWKGKHPLVRRCPVCRRYHLAAKADFWTERERRRLELQGMWE